ncbi:TPA: ABC transporter ATP-binding protein, partial [Escherichia coli]|nr:ABC transporter ATP-binding protein [Escherichia coli]
SLNSLKEFCDVAIVFKNDNAVSFHEDVQEGIEEYRVKQTCK